MKAKRNGDASRAAPAQISPLKQSKSAGNFLFLQGMDALLSVCCVIVTEYRKDILLKAHFIIINMM